MSLVERWHFPMLNDVGRNSTFRTSIAKVVGSFVGRNDADDDAVTILDVGTGFFSFCRDQALTGTLAHID